MGTMTSVRLGNAFGWDLYSSNCHGKQSEQHDCPRVYKGRLKELIYLIEGFDRLLPGNRLNLMMHSFFGENARSMELDWTFTSAFHWQISTYKQYVRQTDRLIMMFIYVCLYCTLKILNQSQLLIYDL